jgi:hypothetical protein
VLVPLFILGGGLFVAGVAQVFAGDDVITTDDVEALARVVTSEAGDSSAAERTAIAWTVRNRARKQGTTVAQLVCTPCGRQEAGRPFSSARAASVIDRALARRVLTAAPASDPTRGATTFFEPKLQDRLVAQGFPGYRLRAAAVRTKWRNEGLTLLFTVGKFEFWS